MIVITPQAASVFLESSTQQQREPRNDKQRHSRIPWGWLLLEGLVYEKKTKN